MIRALNAAGRLLVARSTNWSVNSAGRRMAAAVLGAVDERRRCGDFTMRVGNPLELYRADSLLQKEPETIAWLDETFSDESVLFDVGANVGVYSLYALSRTRGRAVCFEPSALNFFRLVQNLADNGLDHRATAFPVALGEHAALGQLLLSSLLTGAALHGERFVDAETAPARHGMVVRTLDEFLVPELPTPTHLKIDVDGPELAILRGAPSTLATVQHVLVELVDHEVADAEVLLEAAGLHHVASGATAAGMTNRIYRRSN